MTPNARHNRRARAERRFCTSELMALLGIKVRAGFATNDDARLDLAWKGQERS